MHSTKCMLGANKGSRYSLAVCLGPIFGRLDNQCNLEEVAHIWMCMKGWGATIIKQIEEAILKNLRHHHSPLWFSYILFIIFFQQIVPAPPNPETHIGATLLAGRPSDTTGERDQNRKWDTLPETSRNQRFELQVSQLHISNYRWSRSLGLWWALWHRHQQGDAWISWRYK